METKTYNLWIARDKCGALFIYDKEPQLHEATKSFDSVDSEIFEELSSGLFQEVTFENSPRQIEIKII